MSGSKADSRLLITPLALLTIAADEGSGKRQVLSQINQDITQLNELITAYNQTLDHDSRVICLQQLDTMQQKLGTKYPDIFLTHLIEYRRLMHKTLFNAMQQQRELLQVRADYQPLSMPFPDIGSQTAEVINNMVPEEYAKFMAIIAADRLPIRDALLTKVYANDPKGDAYRAFINTHDIEFIGGRNSRNFKFTHRTTQQAVVVRYSTNLNVPKSQEYELRDRLQPEDNFLVPQWADRRASYIHSSEGIQSGRISVIGLSVGKALEKLPWTNFTLEEQQQVCVDASLSQLLLHKKLFQYGKAWPDGKNDNIFFHRDPTSERILATVADCKAFCELAPNHRLGGSSDNWLGTPYLSAPEVTGVLSSPNIADIDADRMAVYTIGKNLYESLLLTDPSKYQIYISTPSAGKQSASVVNEFTKSYFKLPIFKSNTTGQALEAIVQNAVKLDVAQRLSLDEMLQRLIVLKYDSQPTYVELVEKIKIVLAFAIEDTRELSERDKFMLSFYEELLDKRHDIHKLHANLDRIISRCQESVAVTLEKKVMLPLQSAIDKLDKIATISIDDPQLKSKQTAFVKKFRRAIILADEEKLSDIHKELDRVIANLQQITQSNNPTVSYRDEIQHQKEKNDSFSAKTASSPSKR